VSTYHVENFGCRATQADGAALERQFEARGLARTSAAQADLVILNTCTVTNSADQDARSAIRRVRRQNPLAKIVVTGCYAQRAPEEISELPGVSCVIGNSHKHQLADIVLDEVTPGHEAFVPVGALLPSGQRRSLAWPELGEGTNEQPPLFVSDIFAHTELLAAPVFESASGGAQENGRTRPNLKVQDGCDNRCSFCVIPSVRGHSRSLPLPQIIHEVNSLVAAGYREVVISGINLGRWGRDLASGSELQTSGFGEIPEPSQLEAALKAEARKAKPESRTSSPSSAQSSPRLNSKSFASRRSSLWIGAMNSSLWWLLPGALPSMRMCRCNRAAMRCCGGCIENTGPGTIARRSKRFARPCLPLRSAPM